MSFRHASVAAIPQLRHTTTSPCDVSVRLFSVVLVGFLFLAMHPNHAVADDDFGIKITPRHKAQPPARLQTQPTDNNDSTVNATSVAATQDSAVQPPQPTADGMPVIHQNPASRPTYYEIYRSIPFSRSKYRVNSGYRHDATMEKILGQPKPVTIQQTTHSRPRARRVYSSPFRTFYSRYGSRFNIWWKRSPVVYYPGMFDVYPY